MDERSRILICLSAATAANCIPCFEHYQEKADAAGLTCDEILEAAELAQKVKSGAQAVMRNHVRNALGSEESGRAGAAGVSKCSC
jgi:alkylhydroperoxidase/carboxymuconolactone decarboxylase family protein YurZ